MYIMWCSLCVRGVLYMASICTLLGTPCVYTVLWTWPVCYGVLLVSTQYSVHGLYVTEYSFLCVHGILYSCMAYTLWETSCSVCVCVCVSQQDVFCILYSCIACSCTVVEYVVFLAVYTVFTTATGLAPHHNYNTSCQMLWKLIIIMYIYHALINALSAHMIHINLNMIFYTHVKHSPTKTIYIKYYLKNK